MREEQAKIGRLSLSPRNARAFSAFSCVCLSCLLSAPAEALEISFGANVGGFQVGTEPKLAVSAFGGLAWHSESGFLLGLHNMFSILLGSRVGIHDSTSSTVGYTWKSGEFRFGPSLTIYSMLACDAIVCRRVEGAAPGGYAQLDWYFFGRLGGSLSGNVAWYGGASSVLPGNVAAMITVGPILRLEAK